MLSGAVDVWIGNAAAVLSGCWGAATRRAHGTGYSRTSIYTHVQRVEHAGGNEQAGGVRSTALWVAWVAADQLPEAEQQEFAAMGSAMGLILGQIILLLAIVLPKEGGPSRATVGR